ncbi:MAG: hypothetical protein VB857_09195 [Pirellulaceae bacterium]
MERAKVLAVFRNEWQQTFTAGRLTGWLLICGFPVLLTILVSQFGRLGPEATEAWTGILFFVCEIICLLQLLLWATPWLYSELEGKTWTYLAVRPGGKSAVLMGKYLAAAIRTMLGTLAALLLSLLIARPVGGLQVFLVLGFIIVISSFSYAAVFVFLGAMFPKRAMVLAVGYSLVIELLVSFVPAMINQLSIQFRLRSILLTLMDFLEVNGKWQPPRGFEDMLGNSSVMLHIGVLLILNVVLLVVANQLVCRREQVLRPEV